MINKLVRLVLFNAAIVNPISIFAWLDIIVAAIVLLTFIAVDGHENNIKYCWLALVGTVTVGVSFGLPLYLYLKEKQRITLN